MILRKKIPLGLPRRVIGAYLCFCLAAVMGLAIEFSLWGMFFPTTDVSLVVIFLPLLLVGIGAWVLMRQVGPLANVEMELRRIARLPIGQSVDPAVQKSRSAAALGWNRVVEQFDRVREAGDIEDATARLLNVAQSASGQTENAIWKHLADGIAITDIQGRITQANPAMAALLGKGASADDLNGTTVAEHLPTDAETTNQFTDADNHQRIVVCEIETKLGSTDHVIRVARQPLRSDNGAVEGHLWTVRDVTQQKMAEQMRDQFIDAATHELRTPLANIKAYAETLAAMDEPDLESQKEFCNTINSEATRLARFVDDLLSISSMEVGSLSIDRQNVETARLFEEVVDKVKPLMRQKILEFDVQLPGKMPEVKIDKDKIIAMLVNLLGNAVKYTPEGGRVGLKVKSDENQLQIDIDDTGVGIAEEEVGKVFDKFFRSADPRVLEQSGTGLGLSLAREVVRLHGGDISVHSEVDKGSTFSVTLPIRSR